MLRLHTFGGISLFRDDENLTGAVTQRRRLAILVLLATSAEAGMSRDKLIAYLWPESDAERGRHVLNQLLYAQRRQVGDQALFLGRKTLRLNPATIWSDVGAFDRSVDVGNLHEAVRVYRGPFLDGFFVKDAPEFERWVEAQRGRLARRMTMALAALARRASGQGDHHEAADLWQQAADIDPFDSQTALALVQALADRGDRPGALVAARRHEALLRQELGVVPDPAFAAAVARLR